MDLMCQDIHFEIGEKKILKGVSLKLELIKLRDDGHLFCRFLQAHLFQWFPI